MDTSAIRSNVFSLEWPPHSGQEQQFPEADRAACGFLDEARRRILPAQAPLLQLPTPCYGRPCRDAQAMKCLPVAARGAARRRAAASAPSRPVLTGGIGAVRHGSVTPRSFAPSRRHTGCAATVAIQPPR